MGKIIKLSECNIEIIVKQENSSIERELSFEATGADHSEYIKKVLDDDGYNVWLWCVVEVKVSYKGIISGNDYLSQCAYEDEADFKKGGYYDDMVATALAEVQEQFDSLLLEELNCENEGLGTNPSEEERKIVNGLFSDLDAYKAEIESMIIKHLRTTTNDKIGDFEYWKEWFNNGEMERWNN